MAKIGIVLATYNGEKYLPQMLDSLLAQTRPADIIVVVDDGSKDSTVSILESYKDKLPLQITCMPENRGHRAAFSKALEIARPLLADDDLIALADHDDIWCPQKLQQLEEAIETPCDGKLPTLVFGDATVIDAEGKPLYDSWRTVAHIQAELPVETRIAGTNNITGCMSIFRASLLKYILPIPAAVGVHDAWIGLLAAKHGTIKAIDTPVIQYRLHGNNSVGLGNRYSFDETCKRQIDWTDMLISQSNLLNLNTPETAFLQKLNRYWHKRAERAVLAEEFPFLLRFSHFLFPEQRGRLKKVLFSLLGAPAVHLLFGHDK